MNISTINQFVSSNLNHRPKIYVVGDTMVDEYFNVTANRVSPEFPIPVMKSKDFAPNRSVPGGAGNVAAQLKYFNADVGLFGFMDEAAKSSYSSLFNDCSNFCIDLPNGKFIPRKRRFYQQEFPLCRLDIEDNESGSSALVYDSLVQANSADVVIFADYDKGVLEHHENWLHAAKNAITIVDPKNNSISRWRGCTVFKPNAQEALALSGKLHWSEQAKYFKKELNCEVVAITIGGDGVVGMIGEELFEYHPKQSTSAVSVIGAGDTFAAFLGLAITSGLDYYRAIELAWEAGACYVQNRFNIPISAYDLLKRYELKFVDPRYLTMRRDYSLVFTNGCFDIIHTGHVELLKKAKSMGDKLVVALNTDASITNLKGKSRPIIELKDRIDLISSFDFVDFIVAFEEDTPYDLIKLIKPDILVKGGDYKLEEIVGRDLVRDVRMIPLVEGRSTSNIVRKIKAL